ncbi:MAG TPA: hypothetical protein VM238_07465 [Phycisphaerae bacterium]|nr:hypothetical protein [Phycisphaerae bacterium]
MDESALREKVGQLLSEVHRLPQHERAEAIGVGQKDAAQGSAVKREMAAIEDSLDQIRIAVKYLVFDLEATKRENRLLRGLLDEA